MFKKLRSKDFLGGLVFALILVTTINVFASGPIKKQIDVLYNDIKLVVKGKTVTFGKDSNGKQIEPFIYNGTTYLPVRAVGEALGEKIDWDGATQTVYVGEKPGEVNYLTETITPYNKRNIDIHILNDPAKISIAGKEYNTGYGQYDYNSSILRFNLNSQYKDLSFDYGPYKYFKKDPGVLNIYLDDKLYESFIVEQNDDVKQVSINVSGVNQLRIEIENADGDTFIGIGDPLIK